MIEPSSKLPYVPEKHINEEGLRKVGVGIFIVDLNSSKIWVVQEKKSKNGHAGTGREVGDITIPLETRKTGEKIVDNTLGGLAEFRQLCGNEELIWVDGVSFIGRYPLIDGVAADLIILGLRNRCSDETVTINSEEVNPIGWMSIHELRAQIHLRKGVSSLIDEVIKNRYIEKFIDITRQNCRQVRKINAANNLNDLYQQRELIPDL